jgi:hypothetical protein
MPPNFLNRNRNGQFRGNVVKKQTPRNSSDMKGTCTGWMDDERSLDKASDRDNSKIEKVNNVEAWYREFLEVFSYTRIKRLRETISKCPVSVYISKLIAEMEMAHEMVERYHKKALEQQVILNSLNKPNILTMRNGKTLESIRPEDIPRLFVSNDLLYAGHSLLDTLTNSGTVTLRQEAQNAIRVLLDNGGTATRSFVGLDFVPSTTLFYAHFAIQGMGSTPSVSVIFHIGDTSSATSIRVSSAVLYNMVFQTMSSDTVQIIGIVAQENQMDPILFPEAVRQPSVRRRRDSVRNSGRIKRGDYDYNGGNAGPSGAPSPGSSPSWAPSPPGTPVGSRASSNAKKTSTGSKTSSKATASTKTSPATKTSSKARASPGPKSSSKAKASP